MPKATSCFPYKPETSFIIKEITFGRDDRISAQEGAKNPSLKSRADFNKLGGRQFSTFQLRFVRNPVTSTFVLQLA